MTVNVPEAGSANTQIGAVVPRVTEAETRFQKLRYATAAVPLKKLNPNRLPAVAFTCTRAPVAFTFRLVRAADAAAVAGTGLLGERDTTKPPVAATAAVEAAVTPARVVPSVTREYRPEAIAGPAVIAESVPTVVTVDNVWAAAIDAVQVRLAGVALFAVTSRLAAVG